MTILSYPADLANACNSTKQAKEKCNRIAIILKEPCNGKDKTQILRPAAVHVAKL